MKRNVARRLVLVAIASLAALALCGVIIEAGVRLAWDPRKGQPGFYVADAELGQRLGPNYDGWFAGVPVHINNLGFRDTRNYDTGKGPRTFRILVLGDSVTFGHGAVYETTYPYLLEQDLEQWKPEVDWQVWNLGVPGYNTRHELLYLKRVAPIFKPDLVIVGFFLNDVVDNASVGSTRIPAAVVPAIGWLRAHWWSLSWYQRNYLTLKWKLSASEHDKQAFQQLEDQDALFDVKGDLADSASQRVTALDHLSAEELATLKCPTGGKPGPQGSLDMQRDPQWPAFVQAVREMQQWHQDAQAKLVFFLNMAPPVCPDGDFYYDDGTRFVHQVFVDLFGQGTPVVSVFDEFRYLKPSQTPRAGGHSLANVNALKARVLFDYVRNLR